MELCVIFFSWRRRNNHLHSRFTSLSLQASLLGSSTSCPIPHSSTHHPSHTQRGLDSGLPCPAARFSILLTHQRHQTSPCRSCPAGTAAVTHPPCLPGRGASSSAEPWHPQHTTSRNTEISEGNPRQLSQNPQEVELRQGKPLFYYRELWMSAKLVEQELHWFPLGVQTAAVQTPKSLQEIFHTPQPASVHPTLSSGKRAPIRHLVSTQSEGPFSGRAFPLPLCAPSSLRDPPEVQHKRGMPGQGWLHAHCSQVRRVRGP